MPSSQALAIDFGSGPFPQQRLDADTRLIEVPGGGHLVDDRIGFELVQSVDESPFDGPVR